MFFQFEQFYNGRFNGRKLTWLQHLSTGELINGATSSVSSFCYFFDEKGKKIVNSLCLIAGEVKISYLKRPYFITVTTFQMAVILLFNEKTSLHFRYVMIIYWEG